jgi:murein DD-endopeptidase MepM/ murein hydrolase activator NlpD
MKRLLLNIELKLILIFLTGFFSCTSHKTGKEIKGTDDKSVTTIDTTLKVLPQSDSIKKYSARMKRFYRYTDPSKIAVEWFIPFDVPDRKDMKSVKVISGFGTYRSGHLKGHRHSGIDVVPFVNKGLVKVFPSSVGKVCLIRPAAPNKTVIIKHKLNDSTVIYSSYIHLKDIYVENGQEVDQNTEIGVLYTKPEALKFNGNYDHLHFEIKNRIDDYCSASWLCMSQNELDEYFINPSIFWKSKIPSN